jgi:hypothetical protein
MSRPSTGSPASRGLAQDLVQLAKLRWRIEHDYRELPSEAIAYCVHMEHECFLGFGGSGFVDRDAEGFRLS